MSKSSLQGKWLPTVLVCLYFLSYWLPPNLPIPTSNIRWYMALGLAIFAFLLQKRPLDMRAASPFWVVYGVSFLGAVVSLMRAPNFDRSLWNTVGIGISFFTFLLFIPILATKLTRRFLLVALICAAFIWVVEIQLLVIKYGTLFMSTFRETGGNKNPVGFLLGLSATALFYLAAFWTPSIRLPRWQTIAVRLGFLFGGVYLCYNIFLIYDRSGILEVSMGIVAVLIIIFITSHSKASGLFRIGIGVLLIVISYIFFLLPKVLEISPFWEKIFVKTLNEGIDSFGGRELLLRKGLYLVSQNPFLGVGVGGTKDAVSSSSEFFPYYYIHNFYLTEWAEKGILGLLSYFVFVLVFLNFVRTKFFDLQIFDQIWLLLIFPSLFALLYNDTSTWFFSMLVIFTGIYYEQFIIDQSKKTPNISEYERK